MIKIGQSMHPNWINGDLNKLDEELRQFKDAGAQSCELVLQGLDVVIGARIIESRQDAIIKILRDYDFDYTMHMPHGLNLLDQENLEVFLKIFRVSIDFARAAGIKLLNYHAGRSRIDDKKKPDDKAATDESAKAVEDSANGVNENPNDEAKPDEEVAKPDPKTLIQNEIAQIKTLASNAPDIMFCMENAQFGTEPEISAGNDASGMIDYFKQVDQPNFKLTFDIGHSYLCHNGDGAATLEDMKQLLPYIGHIHLHDNCGFKSDARDFGGQRLVTGAGDIHLPLGWGSLPVEDALALLKDYDGIVNLEIEQRFSAYYSECIALVRENLR